MDLVCEVCGESNPPGTEFCTNCNSFLAWDRSDPGRPTQGASKPVAKTARPATTTTPTVNYPTAASAGSANDWGEDPTTPSPSAGYGDQGYPDQTYVDQGYDDQGYGEDFSCPSCGQVNPNTRRFCSHCGYAFYSSDTYDPYADAGSTWNMSAAAQDRAAKREYRRSLPPLYRWRRVLIAVLVAALAIAGGFAVRQDPVGIVKGGWYALNQQYLKVSPIQVTVQPPEATANNSNPGALVDGSEVEWTMNWPTPSQPSSCEAAPGTGQIILTFPSTRIRQVQVFAGLAADNPQRLLQPLPKTLGLSFDNGPCKAQDLAQTADRQTFNIDSGRPVSQLRIDIASAYPTTGADQAPFISLTEVVLKSFPSN